MISAYKSCAAFIREMKKTGALQQYWNVSFVGSRALSNELGDEGRGVQISQVVPFPWQDSIPVVREYQKRIGGVDKVSFTSLEGYIAAKVLVEGLKRAGKNPTRETLVDAMAGIGKIDIGGFSVHYAPDNHNGSIFVDLTIVSRSGSFKH
jgi:ABC-type branched-subunit amino acid transport system substrate-binding protein